MPFAAQGQEMALLASALDTCAIDTNYYVALEALDDGWDPDITPTYDYIDDQGGSYVIPWWDGRFTANRVALLTAALPWKGPYVTFQPGRTQLGDQPYDKGSPLDPWGTPYYFFSPLGLLRGDTGSVTLELYGDRFDRYTIVSLGPDGVMSNDDLLYQFGPGVTSHLISSLSGPRTVPVSAGPNARRATRDTSPDYTTAADSPLTVRGINLFNASGQSEVWWGSVQFSDLLSTTSREIMVHVPADLEGTDALQVRIPGVGQTNTVRLAISRATAAADWALYR
jgi:hypothetical protein